MGRVSQLAGMRGSLKWIQRAVNEEWPSLNEPIVNAVGKDQKIDWRSPLHSDNYAEYRDGAFLERLGLGHLRPELAAYWPSGGPQWDALGVTSGGTVLLVEAKAHIAEMCSPGSSASEASLKLIKLRLDETAEALRANSKRADWHVVFYQLANRLAHLHWLHTQGVDARLVLVNFLNDEEMAGPTSAAEWMAAYHVALHALGLSPRHRLARYVIEVFPDVGEHLSATGGGLSDPLMHAGKVAVLSTPEKAQPPIHRFSYARRERT